MGLDYFASSPTLVVQPQSHHSQFMPHDNLFGAESPMTDMSIPDIPLQRSHSPRKSLAKIPLTPPSMNYHARSDSMLSIAGRKRSREDIGEDLEIEGTGGPVQAPVKPKVEPIMGPGMTLIYPDEPQFQISAESQSGTWMEAKAEDEAKTEAAAAARPKLAARKSMRHSADKIITLSASDSSSTVIDPILLNLGIGWQRLDQTPSPASKGQEAFIRNQFPFTSPELALFHEGMAIYVVRSKSSEATEWDQWWLFTEDLQSCHFLCNNEADLFRRLGNKKLDERGIWRPDILVDGPMILARGSPSNVEIQDGGIGNAHVPTEVTTPMELNVPFEFLAQSPSEDIEMS